jgi:hypothetical protein
MTGAIVLVIGVIALFAAIVGGGIKFRDIEVGSVSSLWRQGLLGAFGIVVSIIGLVLVMDDTDSNNSADEASQNVEAVEPATDANAAEPAATDTNAVDENAADANAADTTADSNATEEQAQPQ